MKAPDKICIRKDDTAPLGLTPHWIYTIKVREHDIEYIRKDALMEWIENKIKISDGGFVNGLICFAYKDVMEHLNSM